MLTGMGALAALDGVQREETADCVALTSTSRYLRAVLRSRVFSAISLDCVRMIRDVLHQSGLGLS